MVCKIIYKDNFSISTQYLRLVMGRTSESEKSDLKSQIRIRGNQNPKSESEETKGKKTRIRIWTLTQQPLNFSRGAATSDNQNSYLINCYLLSY